MTISLNVTSSTAISSYSELQTEILEWLDRDSTDSIADRIPGFIVMAEGFFNQELRTPEMEESYTFSASQEDTVLPGDYLDMRAIYRDNDPDCPLRAMSPDQLRREYGGQSGTPVAFAIIGGSIRLGPVPDSSVTLTMDYFKRIENLTVTSPTNWLLQILPAAYIYATLHFAHMFTPDPEKAKVFGDAAGGLLTSLKKSGRSRRWGSGVRPSTAVQASKGRC